MALELHGRMVQYNKRMRAPSITPEVTHWLLYLTSRGTTRVQRDCRTRGDSTLFRCVDCMAECSSWYLLYTQ